MDDGGIGPSKTMILVRLDRLGTAGISDWPAKLKEVTQIYQDNRKTVVPFGNVEV